MRQTVRRWMVSLVIILTFGLMLNIQTSQAYAESPDSVAVKTNELLVKYSKDYRSLAETEILHDLDDVEVIAPQVKLLTFTDDADMESIKVQLENNPSVESVEPNYKRQLLAAVNDPYYSSQWWVPHVKAESMWAYAASQQEKVVVAVIDSGIDTNHEDLKGRIEPGGYNFYSNNTNVTDLNGHGTNVSGVIAAELGNGRGISGVAGPYNVSILPLKVSHMGGASVSDVIKAIDYAIAMNVGVINISLGGTSNSTLESEAIQRAIRADIVIVAAAGNDAQKGNPIFYPASYDHVISVGAVDKSNLRSSFSNYNRYVDLVAPGERILTTFPYQSYDEAQGTSFSAPVVSGTVAMMKALEPKLSIGEIEDLLKSTAKDLGAPGHDSDYGAGVLDIEKLTTKLTSLNPPELPVAVTGVKLNTNELNMDMRALHQSFDVSEEYLEQLKIARDKAAIVHEREPNNTYSMANTISAGDSIVGSITDYYFDLDQYKFTLDSEGTLSLLGGWLESAYVNHRNNDDLAIGLYDGQQKMIGYASLQTMLNGQKENYLSTKLKRGTYYLVVFQSSNFQYVYTNERYMVTTMFTRDQAPEIPPTILFDQAFMKKGEEKPYVSGSHSKSIFASSNPSVATIDSYGKVRAVGHGTTVISHSIGTDVAQSTVKVTGDLIKPTTALFEELLPGDAANKNVTWISSNNEVATVDKYGIISGKRNGKAIITVITADGGHKANATVTVTGEDIPEFVGDFPEMTVPNLKVFTVTFNQELEPGKDYSKDILITRKVDGKERVTSFTAMVDSATPTKLLITPTTKWAVGEHYLTIKTSVQNKNNKALKENVRMKFEVEDGSLEVNSLQEYKRIRGIPK